MTLLVSILSLGCTASPAPIQDEATPNIEATITAAIQTAIPNPANLETPNIDATVEAKVRGTQEAALRKDQVRIAPNRRLVKPLPLP